MKNIKIATWNIRIALPIDLFIGRSWFFYRFVKVIKRIKKEKPDIVCLQEILHPIQLFMLWIFLRNKYDFNTKYATLNLFNGKSTLVKKMKFKKIGYKQIKFSSKWGSPICLSFTETQLPNNIKIVNTHLDARWNDVKNKQAQEICDYYKNDKGIIFIMGDFNGGSNLFPGWYPMVENIKTTKTEWYQKEDYPNNHIDWILCNKELEFENSFTIEDKKASDHYYLQSEIKI